MLQTRNNSPDLLLGDPAHITVLMAFVVPCTIINVIILKSVILGLVNKEFRNVLSQEVSTLNINPKVAKTLRRITLIKENNLRRIERAAFNRY